MIGAYYERLGVSEDATLDEIRRGYRRAVKLHHPDHGGSVKEFERVTEAYNKLKDPESRRKYDADLALARADPNAVVEALREQLEADGRGPSPLSAKRRGDGSRRPPPRQVSRTPDTGDIGAAGAKGGFWGLIASAVPCAISMALFGETAVGVIFMFASFFGTIFAGARLAIWMERKHPGVVSQ